MHAAVLGRTDGPDVVCVHGLGCSHRYFGPLAEELAPFCRVIAPDLPGFGRTLGPPNALDVRGMSRTGPRQFLRLLLNMPLERPSLARIVRDYYDAGARRVLATFRLLIEDPVESKLHCLQTPAVVVRGGRDPIAPSAWCAEFTAGLPDATLVEVAGAGHTVNYSAPGPLAEVVRLLIDRYPVERAYAA